MRIAMLFALVVGCGGQVSEGISPDASSEVEADGREALGEIAIPAGCGLGENPCYREFLAAIEGTRACFPHFGGTCGKQVGEALCSWSDGATAPIYAFTESGSFTSSETSCLSVAWDSSGRLGTVTFASGARFRLTEHQATGFNLACPSRGSSFSLGELGGACGDTIRTCCRR